MCASSATRLPQLQHQLLERAIGCGIVDVEMAERARGILLAAQGSGTPRTVASVLEDDLGVPGKHLGPLDVDRFVGRIVGGFQLEKPIGVGGCGMVFAARQVSLDRKVAIKVLDEQIASLPHVRERFVREAKAAAKLQHPHVVQPIDFGDADGTLYFAMEFMDGGNVGDRITSGKLYAEREALAVVRDIAKALVYAAEHGIVHRDIKPQNILFDAHGTPGLCDLGLVLETKSRATRLTTEGAVVGTPHYLAPEQAMGKARIDQRADIYALGITLFEMLTGSPPFLGTTATEIMLQHVREPLPRVTELAAGVSKGTESLLLRMCAKRPAKRFRNAILLLRAIETLLAGLAATDVASAAPATAPAKRPHQPETATETAAATSAAEACLPPSVAARSRRMLPIAGLLAVGLVIAVLTLWSRRSRDRETGTPPAMGRAASTPIATSAPDPVTMQLVLALQRGLQHAAQAEARGEVDAALATYDGIVLAGGQSEVLALRSTAVGALLRQIALLEQVGRLEAALAKAESLETFGPLADMVMPRTEREARLTRLRGSGAVAGAGAATQRRFSPVVYEIAASGFGSGLVVTDLDGDGRSDAIITGSVPHFLSSRGGSLRIGTSWSGVDLAPYYSVTGAVDLDHSGLLELVLYPRRTHWPERWYVVQTLPLQRSTAPKPRWLGAGPGATRRRPGLAAAADLDGDRQPELVLWESRGAAVVLRYGGPDFPAAREVEVPVRGEIRRVATARGAGGGGRDAVLVLVTHSAPNGERVAQVLSLTGLRDKLRRTIVREIRGATWPLLEVGDWSGDGVDDIVTNLEGAAGKRKQLEVLRGVGDGRFEPVSGATPLQRSRPTVQLRPVFADLDGDSREDIVMVEETGSDPLALRTLLSKGDGTFQSAATTVLEGVFTFTQVAPGDVDGDGRLDLFLYTDPKAVTVVFGDGKGGFRARPD